MARRITLVAGIAAVLAGWSAAAAPALGASAAASASKSRLASFSSCDRLLSYARRTGSAIVGSGGVVRSRPGSILTPVNPAPVRGGTPGATGAPEATSPTAAPVAGTDFSQTNTQEADVDEPDIVKTDGKTAFVSTSAGKIHSLDVSGGSPKLLDSVSIEGGFGDQLLLHGDRLLVISSAPQIVPLEGPVQAAVVPYPSSQRVHLTEIDVSNPAKLRVMQTLTVDGRHVDSRLTGGVARVVISTQPRALYFPAPQADSPAAAQKEARRSVRRATLSRWLPSSVLRNRATGHTVRKRLVGCRSVRYPHRFSGPGTLSVLTINLAKGLDPVDVDSVMTDAQVVYASSKALYVATQLWQDSFVPEDRAAGGVRTQIHKFEASEGRTSYQGSGSVRGFLLNQFSLSERDGLLRVASTTQPVWVDSTVPRSESYVTVMREREGRLVQVGRLGGIGSGERIYAVRFIGDLGYVVTFRQIDPLFTIDLSSPSRPRVAGELKLRGYSAYLHPAGNDLLIGVGQDATATGQTLGTQLSLFDVSDPANPKRVQQRTIASGSSSEVEFDHHAFLYWAPTHLVVLPVQIYPVTTTGPATGTGIRAPESSGQFTGAIGFRADRSSGIDEVGRITHDPSGATGIQIRRSFVAGDHVFTVSDSGLGSNRLDNLGRVAFAQFPTG